jgi:hypothetical protein
LKDFFFLQGSISGKHETTVQELKYAWWESENCNPPWRANTAAMAKQKKT